MTVQERATISQKTSAGEIDMKLEVVVIPVSDVERAKSFYVGLGWRLDADVSGPNEFRVIQVTPPGSPCSVIFGSNITFAKPGSAQGLHLIVSDIEMANAALAGRGAEMSGVFHDAGGVFHHKGTDDRVAGPNPSRASYGSFASFADPDGNGWVLQEITNRLPGRVDGGAAYSSSADLASALRRAADAHGEHEKQNGGVHDEKWPEWYAAHMLAEVAGAATI
ncbi:VOC family protein [Rhizobium leguminosarum]|uniref:Glyoxalase/bleomycin resistance protein/dioxygenase family protein n=1 Tax=Rhizobium leguminosarum TaxID=384 RepID=A0A2K9Z3E3_RHILE|nr:VOC family protein [Rhizobium leguminosarum]AUW42621.1 Glyoxalase/bleomycin resistance protein/dioxygenase family protein [Rhizobium leguminosarum]